MNCVGGKNENGETPDTAMIRETEEMTPKWFDINEIPYENMLPDDKYWLPLVLSGKKIKAYFEFDEDWNLLSKNINELNDENSRILVK